LSQKKLKPHVGAEEGDVRCISGLCRVEERLALVAPHLAPGFPLPAIVPGQRKRLATASGTPKRVHAAVPALLFGYRARSFSSPLRDCNFARSRSIFWTGVRGAGGFRRHTLVYYKIFPSGPSRLPHRRGRRLPKPWDISCTGSEAPASSERSLWLSPNQS
jgi:hypothetical protein